MNKSPINKRNPEILLPILTNLGTDYRCYKMAKSLKGLGYKPVILCDKPYTPPGSIWEEFDIKILSPVSHLKNFKWAFFLFNLGLAKYLMFTKSVLWIAEDYPPLFMTALMGKIRRVRVIYDSHELALETNISHKNVAEKRLWHWLIHTGLKWVTDVIIVSALFKDYYENLNYKKKFCLIPNLPYKHELKNKTGRISAGIPHFLFQGYLRRDVHLDKLILALKGFQKFVFTIIGSGFSKPALEKLAVQSGLESDIHFQETVPFEELLNYGSEANIGVFLEKSSLLNTELTWSNKLFEYVQRGLPVLAGDTRSNKVLMEKYEVGVCVDPFDPKSIRTGLQKIMENYGVFYQNTLRLREELIWEKNEIELGRLLKGNTVSANG